MNPHQVRHFVSTALLLAAIVFASCETQKERNRAQALQKQNDSLRTAIEGTRKDFDLRVHRYADKVSDARTGLWRLDTLSETGRVVLRTKYPNASVYDIAKALNAAFRADSVSQFKINKVQEHTAYVKILDSGRLTQGLGPTGTKEYLAQVTFSLTSVPGIQSVDFDFEEGDHATPGTYDWERFAEIMNYKI